MLELRDWLVENGCTSTALESTGSYWKPVRNVLKGTLEMVLVCARKHHPKKGDKSDFRDAIQLVHYHRHGLLSGSYLPAPTDGAAGVEGVAIGRATLRWILHRKLRAGITAQQRRDSIVKANLADAYTLADVQYQC